MAMVYDLPSVDASPQPSQQYAAPESKNYNAEQTHEMGNAVTKAGAAVLNIAQDMQNTVDTAAAKEMDNKLADVIRTTLTNNENGYLKTAGKAAVDGRAAVEKALKDAVKGIEEGSENKMQTFLFKKAAAARVQTAMGQVGMHSLEQAKIYEAAVTEARSKGFRLDAVNNFAGWNDKEGLYAKNKAGMLNEIDQFMTSRGIGKSDPIYKAAVIDNTTRLHTDTINLMVSQGKTKDAKEYFDANIGEIAADKRDELTSKVRVGTVATEGDNMASQIWAELAPKTRNGAVPIFQMEERARALAGDNEDVQKAAIAGLRERASGFNAEQSEFKAQNIASAWKMHDKGVSINQIKLTPEWDQLTGKEQHEILAGIESERATRAARAAANSQRELADLERRERLSFMKNGDAYLTMTDPQVLKRMTRAQIEAKRGQFGMTATQHLLAQWDSIQNPAKFKDAQWESDSFKAAVRGLGMNPDSKNKDERDRIGALKYHVEQSLNHAMNATKTTMTPEQKDAFIKKELSNQVLVDPGMFSRNKSVPIVSLTTKQVNQVVIPKAEVPAISNAMREMYKRTGNAEFNPTPYNMKMWYLRQKSPGFSAFQGEQ